jgi:hypothetical protein
MLNKNFKGMTIEIYPIAFLVIYPRNLPYKVDSYKYLPFEEE